MSLLAELEELQRCLEGTAGSDSEGADNHAVPATDFKVSEKAVKSSCTNEKKSEGTVAVQDPTSSCPLVAQSVRKNSSNESATKNFVAGSGSSATKSTAKILKLQASSLQNNASTRLVSKRSEKEVHATTTHTATVKNDSPDSAVPLTNVGKDSAGVKVSNAKTITDTSVKKDCPAKHVKIPALKQAELEVRSLKPPDVKVFTCKMDNTSGVSRGLLHKVLHSASAEKKEKGSLVSEFKVVPASFSALASEKVSGHKLSELKDKNDVKSSPLQTVGNRSELKINANVPKGVARQAQFIVPAKGKLVKVKLHSSAVKTPSDCGLLFVSKSKNESSTLGQPSCSTSKRPILYIKKTLGTKSSIHSDCHTGGSETVGRVQPAPGRSVFSLDSKMPRLEEVKISDNRPVVRILNASADSDKSTSARAGASVSSASFFVIRKGNVPKEGGSANTSPVIMKRKRSFEAEPAVGRSREECPPVSHKTYMHVKPKGLKIIDAEPNIKKKKVSADAASVSSNTATVQEVRDDKLSSMSVEITKKEHEKPIAPEIPERAEEQPLPDGSINKRNFSDNSENAFVKSATLHQNCEEKHAPEACTKLGLEKGIVLKAPKPEAVTITADSPLARKRRALSDTVVCGDINKSEGQLVSQDKRRKLSASEGSSLAEETLKSETVIDTAGIIKVARSPPTRRVPITSTMEVTISPHGVEQNVQTPPVCKSEQCEVNGDDLEMEKDDPGKKEFMEAKVILEKLPMPVPGCLLSPPAQVKMKVKPEPQSLQKTLESVSVVLQATLPEKSVGNQKLLELTKLQDELADPVKKQKIVKREMLQNKTTGKPPQQKITGKQAEQKIVRKPTQQKTVGKQSQEKIVRKQTAQKIMGKQKTVGKQTQQKIIGKQTQQRSMGKRNKQTVTGKQSQQKVLGKQASQTVIRKQSQQKIVKRLSQQKVIGRPSQHKYAGKPQHKVLGKSSQQKVIGRAYPQKITNKPMQQQKTLSKQKSIQKASPRNVPSIAVRIAAKKKKKKETPKKVVSSGNRTKPQKMEPSVTAKKTIKAVSFGNVKYKQVTKSAVNQGPEAEKRIITMKEKNVTLNKIKENKFYKKEEMIVPPKNEKITFEERKKEREPPEMKIIQSAMKTVQQGKPVAMKRLAGPKKIVSDDRRMKKSQGILMEPSEPNGCNTAADDEWIVEVLLDDSEVNMMTVNSQVQVGQETHSSSVSSSDDTPKDLHVSTRNLDGNHLLECDSSTDLHRRSEAVGGAGEAWRNISASKSNPCRTILNTNVKQKVALPSLKQVTSSFNNTKRTGISQEQKMAEMRKAIGDLERIADRCMLRLKAEERQVSLLANKLHPYENDKHYNMLSKILKDAAPGPKQNPHAEFILDLLLSYCPDDDSGCQETLPAPV